MLNHQARRSKYEVKKVQETFIKEVRVKNPNPSSCAFKNTFTKKGFKLGMQMIHWVFFIKIRREDELERGTIVSPENRSSYLWKTKKKASK